MLEYDKGRLRNFPHIYYVNLDNRTDRREYMEKQFEFWRLDFTRISSSKYAATLTRSIFSFFAVILLGINLVASQIKST